MFKFFSAAPTTPGTITPTVTSPPPLHEYQVEVEIDIMDTAVFNQLKNLPNYLPLPYTVNNVTIIDVNITTGN